MRSRKLTVRQITSLEAVADAAATLDRAGFPLTRGEVRPDSGVMLPYTPPARANAIQMFLYREAWSQGVAPLPIREAATLRDIPWPGPTVCHFHWLGEILKGATSADADERIVEFAELLADLRKQGRKLLWTVHNFLPHDTPMPDKDLEIRKILAEEVDAIHVMAKATAEVVSRGFHLPEEKTFYTPHPAYQGAYPDVVTKVDARGELGIGGDEFVFVLFGAIMRYKGVQELMGAFETLTEMPTARPVRLILAGASTDTELEQAIRSWATGRDEVILDLRRIPNDDVQYYMRAADAAVLPYREVLNSGSAMLALTFGLPIVAPSRGVFVELVTEYAGITYDPDHPDGLVGAMHSAIGFDTERATRRIATRTDAVHPGRVSEAFLRGLFDTLGWPRRTAEFVEEDVLA